MYLGSLNMNRKYNKTIAKKSLGAFLNNETNHPTLLKVPY